MHIQQALPAELLERLPAGLLHLDHDGRVDHANPAALDLLGRSVFDVLDRPADEVLGASLPPAGEFPLGELVATVRALDPPYQGKVVGLRPASQQRDEALHAGLDALASQLERLADLLPPPTDPAARLAIRELLRALASLDALRRRDSDARLEALIGGPPDAGEVELVELVRESLVGLSAELRLARLDITLTRDGHLSMLGTAALVGRAVDEVLRAALDRAHKHETLTIALTGDGQTVSLSFTPVSPDAGRDTYPFAYAVADHHGGHAECADGALTITLPVSR